MGRHRSVRAWQVQELRELRDQWPTRSPNEWAAYFAVDPEHMANIARQLGLMAPKKSRARARRGNRGWDKFWTGPTRRRRLQIMPTRAGKRSRVAAATRPRG